MIKFQALLQKPFEFFRTNINETTLENNSSDELFNQFWNMVTHKETRWGNIIPGTDHLPQTLIIESLNLCNLMM